MLIVFAEVVVALTVVTSALKTIISDIALIVAAVSLRYKLVAISDIEAGATMSSVMLIFR